MSDDTRMRELYREEICEIIKSINNLDSLHEIYADILVKAAKEREKIE